nr:MAG TPA: hypothetical protein [Crassvirales sp.]
MACILINGEVQSTFSIKDLEQAIRDICSRDNGIDTLPTPIGYKTVVPEEHVSFICPSEIQEDIDKEIINSLHSYKPFSKYLSNG